MMQKRIIRMFLLLCFIFSTMITAQAEEEIRPLGVYLGNVFQEYTAWDAGEAGLAVPEAVDGAVRFGCYGMIPYIQADKETAGSYPALCGALDVCNERLASRIRALLNEVWKAETEHAAAEMEQTGYSFINHTAQGELFIARSDTKVLSYMEHIFWYTGNSHDSEMKIAHAFDVQTGKELTLDDVITDRSAAASVLKKELEQYLFGDSLTYAQEVIDRLFSVPAPDPEEFSWTLGRESVSFYFNPGTLSSSLDGVFKLELLFREHPGLCTGLVTDLPDRGVSRLLTGTYFLEEYTVDPEQNGEPARLMVTAETNDEDPYDDYIHGIEITLGEKSLKKEIAGYRLDTYLVAAPEGEFLYVQSTSDNDWCSIDLFRLTGGPVWLGTVGGALSSESWEDLDQEAWSFIDPRSFYIRDRGSLLGTMGIYRRYHIGEDGMPVPETPRWSYLWSPQIKALMDVKAQNVDDSGMAAGETLLQEGETFTCVSTDNESTVDLRREDGSLVRVTVGTEEDGWPQLVGGVQADQVFEGLIYVG